MRPISRERFRVYSEDEFLAQSEHAPRLARLDQAMPPHALQKAGAAGSSSRPEMPVRASSSHGSGGVRVAVATVLLAGVGGLGLALSLHMLAATTHSRRRALLRSARAGASVSPASEAARGASRPPVRRFARREPARRSQKPARTAADQTRAASRRARQVPAAPAVTAGDSGQGEVVAKAVTVAVVAGSTLREGRGEFGFER